MASRQRIKEQRWPLGTKIRKHFEGHGDFDGEVKEFHEGLYSIEYSDGDKEQFDEREMKRYLLKTPSFASTPKPSSKPAGAAKKQRSQKKAPTSGKEKDTESGVAGKKSATGVSLAAAGNREDGADASTAQAAPAAAGNEKMLRDIEAMHQELEVTGYTRGKGGQKRRKIARNISKIRTQKRRALEKADAAELAIMAEDDNVSNSDDDDDSSVEEEAAKKRKRKRKLRGSMAALEDDVLEGSMIFQAAATRSKKGDNSDGDVGDEDGAEDNDDEHEGDEEEITADSSVAKRPQKLSKKTAPKRKKTGGSVNAGKQQKKRRQMYRLRNFQSFKMAQRHGDALAAHAQGNYRLAIHKLKAVSKDAPSAPQVYASLGMVYEDMLKESKSRYLESKTIGDTVASLQEPEHRADGAGADAGDQSPKIAPFIPNSLLQEQCDLAKKAYGSHHISAILCKKDFSLWVRSGNCAIDIADLHEEISLLPGLSEDLCSAHKAERRRWLDEALRDLLMADNLSPPGIDVPAKLAAVHMDLGNLSEALTILTDLKNGSGREFHASYKAWLLYADLMLRFGHECTQWNQNVQTTDNYMVRRWLRKHSATFDWQERRTQALALALVAAAGTKSAQSFLDWIQNHAMNVAVDSEHGGVDKTLQSTGGRTKNSNGSSQKELEQERGLLQMRHQREMDEFDKTTSEMELVSGSDPEKNRDLARQTLVESHGKAVSTLENEYTQHDMAIEAFTDTDNTKFVERDQESLPMSASVGVVCSIASDLMKHLIRLEIYSGARLAGEVVSKYMRERARLTDRTLHARKRANEWQERVSISPFLPDAYGEEENLDEEDEEMPYLSDEDSLVNTAGESTLLESLRRGALPPELRILSGIAMIGEGGRNFVASKYVQSIEDLEQESKDWLCYGDEEAEFSREPRWFFFHRTMTEDLTKTVAYSYLADTLNKTNKEAEWALHFAPMFFNHLEALKEKGVVEELVKINKGDITANGIIRRSQILKVMLASCSLGLNTLDVQEGATVALGMKADLCTDELLKNAVAVLDTLDIIASLLWSVSRQGEISQPCIQMVGIASKCVGWISRNIAQADTSLLEVVRKVQKIVSYFVGGNRIPELGGVETQTERSSLLEATRFPLSVSWQPLQYRTLSDRTYNVAAACNALPFSGWENEKFSTRLLKRRCGTDHPSLHVLGTKVTGLLPSRFEEELKRQWDCFEALEPELPTTNFQGKLEQVKNSDWYKNEIEGKGCTPDFSSNAKYAEEDALSLFLAYSSLCLALAESSEAGETSFRYKQLALSVLLPICRFCLDESLWDSDSAKTSRAVEQSLESTRQLERQESSVPKDNSEPTLNEDTKEESTPMLPDGDTVENQFNAGESNDKSDFEEWRQEAGETIFEPLIEEFQHPQWNADLETLVFDQNFPIGEPSPVVQMPVRKRTRKIAKPRSEKSDGWHRPGSGILKKFVALKCSELKRLWVKCASELDDPDAHDLQNAKTQMNKVHSCMQNLRACFTFSAAEKNCVALCVALLDLAASPCCKDPFTCLQQASMYASQAPKAGNSDMSFRRNVPALSECSPRTALVILGRADCLHAGFFPEEAAFLCSYVARACALRRNSSATSGWNDQWKVVGMYAYNVSVMIRATMNSMMKQSKAKSFSNMWDQTIIRELETACKDAKELAQSSLHVSDGGMELELEETDGKREAEVRNTDDHVEDDEDNEDEENTPEDEQVERGNPSVEAGVDVYGV